MIKSFRAGATGLLLSLALAAPAAAATSPVSVRVEGQNATLLPRTTLTPPDRQLSQPDCPPESAANALDAAVNGNWDHQEFTQTVLGETHDFSNSDYWNVWVFRGGHYVVSNGMCSEKLAAGEELLVAYQVAPAPDYAPQLYPLWIQGTPPVASPGTPFTVTVEKAACETAFCNPGEGHAVPASGATITAGGVTATTDATGKATLTLTQRGPVSLRATASGATPSASEPTCVSDGSDGSCGTTAPHTTPGAPAPVPAPIVQGPDRDPATVTITHIKEGQHFKTGPRRLTATVENDPSGLHAVKLSLTRKVNGRCTAFSGRKERFRRERCGRHPYFVVGKSTDVDYLLPRRLAKGRYVLDVVSIDGAYNRDPLARGRNRVVFRVG